MLKQIKSLFFSVIFKILLTVVSLSGLAIYLHSGNPAIYEKTLVWHYKLGIICFLALGFFFYSQTKGINKKYAKFFGFYPLFSVASLQTPTPLVFTFIFNLTVVPVWLYFMFVEKVKETEKINFLLKFIFFYFLCFTVVTGIIPILDPTRLKFSSFFRKVHGYFVFLFINTYLYYFLSYFNLQFLKSKINIANKNVYRVLIFIIFFSPIEFHIFKIIKNIPLKNFYQKNTYRTKSLTDKEKKIFKTLDYTLLNRSEDCHKCHKIPFNQWKVSNHAFAGKNISFLKVLKSLTSKYGMEFGRLCITCHEPALAYSKNLALIFNEKYLKEKSEGVSCRACHYISKVQPKNAYFETTIPRVDLTFELKSERQNYILNSVQEHLSDVSKSTAKDGSVCFPCHSLESVRLGKTLIPYDNVMSFLNSPYNKIIKCHDCHMPRLVADKDRHYSWKDHRMFGSQHYLNQVAIIGEKNKEKNLKQIKDFENKTLQWLSGKLSFIEMIPTLYDETVKSYRIYNYFNAYKKLKIIYSILNAKEPFAISLKSFKVLKSNLKNKNLQLNFSILNKTIGHNFPSSLFANISKNWVELKIFDCQNKEIAINLPPHILGRIEIKNNGTPIKPQESKLYTKIINNEFLQPLKEYPLSFSVKIKNEICFPLKISLAVKTQRYINEYYHWIKNNNKTNIKTYVLAQKDFIVKN